VRANEIAAIKRSIYRSCIEPIAAHRKSPLCARKVLRLYGAKCANDVGCVPVS
jgi:hypothetical protein